ncbi:MAG: hypothetical protein Q8M07_20070 [Prosthecobacter sp.]|nr:hypothetical protein [Prosthecobacter sp.]HBJ88023.1 hypothetical protein [Verrucomicrobiales bacterium]
MKAFLFISLPFTLGLSSCVYPPPGPPVARVGVGIGTGYFSTLPPGFSSPYYYYGNRYYYGGRWEPGHYTYQGHPYAGRYFYNGRYLYGGTHHGHHLHHGRH